MSGSGKRKDEQDHPSDEEHAPPKKTTKHDDSEDSNDDIVVCEISKNRKVSVRNWKGRIWVDIREFYVKDGKHLPGKKGISMSLDQWNILRDHVEDIDKALADAS